MAKGKTKSKPKNKTKHKAKKSSSRPRTSRPPRGTKLPKDAVTLIVLLRPREGQEMLLEGELRARINVLGQETILATLSAGDFFGDISLFDQGPRSADVVANSDSMVVSISAEAFDKLAKEAPEIATPFLRAIGRTMSARIRTDNKRYGDAVKFSRAA